MLRSWWLFLGISAISTSAVAVGCSGGDDNAAPSAGDDGGLVSGDASLSSDGGSPSDGSLLDAYIPPLADGGTAFAYRPGWAGVTEVDVIGGFGTSDDWDPKNPYAKLVNDGTGNYTATANLPAGVYAYLFYVVGDSASNDPKYDRLAVDPLNVAIIGCPAGSPTAGRDSPPNPCSQLTVGTPDVAPVHVRGVLTVDGAPAVGWLVSLSREEKSFHHFFANRVTAGSDGSYDLIGSAGSYKIDIDLPTALNTNDIDRDPLTLNVVKSAGSMPFPIGTTDIALGSPDLAFHDYGSFAPTGDGGSLPTTFMFEKGRTAAVDVYGAPSKGGGDDAGVIETGDPWFTSDATNKGKVVYDGSFNSKGDSDAAVPGVRYMWGTEEPVDAGAPWKIRSLVFPITWH